VGKFLTDPVWWFYLFWLPGFLNRSYGIDLSNLGLPLVVVYQASTIGSIGGGWISSSLLKRGWKLNAARKTAMLVCALAVTSVVFVARTGGNMWLAVALVSVAAAAHQGWSANLFTLASDMFPRGAVGSVVGFGGMGGAIGGMLVAPAVGYWLDWSHGAYGPLFVVAGSMYLIALALIHLLVPKLEKAR
jgi:ACS family hexuronate transporter-like MFS transporter